MGSPLTLPLPRGERGRGAVLLPLPLRERVGVRGLRLRALTWEETHEDPQPRHRFRADRAVQPRRRGAGRAVLAQRQGGTRRRRHGRREPGQVHAFPHPRRGCGDLWQGARAPTRRGAPRLDPARRQRAGAARAAGRGRGRRGQGVSGAVPAYDLVLRGGSVLDGTGAPAISADVALAGDRIAAVGRVPRGCGRQEIDVAGLAVAPGFIDVHTHDDRALLATSMDAKVSQGVTTVISGNCGISLAPLLPRGALPPPLDLIGDEGSYRFPRFAAYLDALDAAPPATNAACLVGHSTLRVGAMDALDRPASDSEIAAMRRALGEALAAGAIGLSSGLWYAPANAAPHSELLALATDVGAAGAIYTTHMRDEADHVLDSLDETFALGREASVPVVISHHK